MTREDGDLIRRAKAGDRSALADLLVHWDRPMLAVAYRILGDVSDAADVRQQAFVRVCESLSVFDEQARFSTWLYRIVVNLCRDRIRHRGVQKRTMAKMSTVAGHRATDAGGGEAGGRAKDVAAVVSEAVGELPPAEREAIVLRHYAGLSFAEMAATLDVPVSTLKSRVLRALDRLRIRLRDADGLRDEWGAMT